MKKYIYFPNLSERKSPQIIYVDGEFMNEYRGSPIQEEVEQGRRAYYLMSRCLPYSDELWEQCIDWVSRYFTMQVEYQSFLKKKKKKSLA